MKEKVFVGLSGGVDSAVSAALLKEAGYDVTGAFIKIWSPEFTECTWQEDRLDAMRVCAALDVPFREVDLSREYMQEIVSAMTEDYAQGITPNPDVLCNRAIKFGHFARWALAEGAEKIATGHYAQIRERASRFELLRGADLAKDQSYFLYQLTQADFSHTLFPVGGFVKSHVRQLAEKFDLPVAKKRDSQGLCFVGDISLKEFLSRFIPLKEGDVIDLSGTVIGAHDGAVLVTIGQRHGFSAGGTEPHYAIGIDIEKNLVRVSPRREDAATHAASMREMHWIAGEPQLPLGVHAQARYREEPFAATIDRTASGYRATFSAPRIVAPGQSLVLYDGDTCLGGGIINK